MYWNTIDNGRYDLLKKITETISLPNYYMIGGRGAKKDFYDLYNIINICKVTIDELCEGVVKKCGNNINYANVIMGLSYFEDAELQVLPSTFVEYDWEEIKMFFIKLQIDFQKKMESINI